MVTAPATNPGIQALKDQGDKAYAARDFNGAIERYSEALEVIEDAVVLSNRSATYAQRRRFDKALNDAEHAILLQPTWPRLYHRLGHALFHLGDYADAIWTLEEGLRLAPEDQALMEARDRAKEYTEPDESPCNARSSSPKARNRCGGRGAAAKQGASGEPKAKSKAAAKAANDARAPPVAKSAPAAPKAAAKSEPKSDANAEAKQESKPAEAAAAPAAGPSGGGAKGNASLTADEIREKGNTLFRSGKHSAAIRTYSEAIDKDPSDARSYANRAAAAMAILHSCGKNLPAQEVRKNPYYNSAMEDLEQATTLDGKYVKAWARKGQLHLQARDVRSAFAAFQRGLDVEPSSPECAAGKNQCLDTM